MSNNELNRDNPFKYVSNKARISEEFNSRKDSQSIKLEQRPQNLANLKFRELCDSKLSRLHPFGKTAILLNQKKEGKIWKVGCEIKKHFDPWSDFCDPHWELFCCNKWNEKTLEISTPAKIVVGMHFMHDMALTKTSLVF